MPEPFPTTSGKKLRATVNGTTIKGVTDIDINDRPDPLDRTTADENGYTSTDTGVADLEITISGLWKITDGPFPTLAPETIVQNVIVQKNTDYANTGYTLPYAIVTSCRVSTQVRGQSRYTITIKNRGEFTRASN